MQVYNNLKFAYDNNDMQLLSIMRNFINPEPPLFDGFSEPEFKYVYELIKGLDGWCVDVGANVGDISETLLKWGHKCLMIEPVEKYYEQLKRLLSYPNTVIYNYACYSQNAIIKLFSMPDGGGFETTDVDQLKSFFSTSSTKRYDESVITQRVFAKKLQSILDRENISDISLLKIDVDGGDLDVLKGISDKQFDKIEYIYLEFPMNIVWIDESGGITPRKMIELSSFLFDRKFYYVLLFQHSSNYGEDHQEEYNILRFDYGGKEDLVLDNRNGSFCNAIFSNK